MNKGSLERRKLLEQLPGWQWRKRFSLDGSPEEQWMGAYTLMREFVKREGHAQVRKYYVTKTGYRLGEWVWRQRYLYWRNHLSRRRLRLLKKLAGWDWGLPVSKRALLRTTKDAMWHENFSHLLRFARYHGHVCVPAKYISKDGFALGHWVNGQRNAYRRGRMKPARRRLLVSVRGWKWTVAVGPSAPPDDSRWRRGFELLRQHVNRGGNANLPSRFLARNGYALGRWIRKQKADFRKGGFSPEKQQMLEGLPGWRW